MQLFFCLFVCLFVCFLKKRSTQALVIGSEGRGRDSESRRTEWVDGEAFTETVHAALRKL